ncbi:MAG: tRNA pseudouridine(38-40) synthase TruA [Clostridiales bacterium]|nr:tRNA pseudouridine(38-40) synthase TruA [Clostridiales bacterium]
MRYLLIVSYNGINYSGFQKQKKGNTIQDELENAIKIFLKEEINCVGSGRTDAKVSAYMQPVHFETEKEIESEKFLRSVNAILPEDIKILSITKTKLHARFSAKRKTYCYKMYSSNIELPLMKDALKISPNLNFKHMKKFLKMIVGTHDFEGFKASGSSTETSVRTIYKAKLIKQGAYLNFYITGNGFLYKMVRNIVGTMLKIGEGKLSLDEVKKSLFTSYKCTNTAKPDYLYLLNVKY